MKRLLLNIILILFLAACHKNDLVTVKQISSKEFVTIEDNYMDRNAIKDSFRITIPNRV